MDDTAAERPHAEGSRLANHSRASSQAWVYASMGLGEDLKLYRGIFPSLRADINKLWYGYKSILQTSPTLSDAFVPKRMTDSKFISIVYGVSHVNP